MIEVEGFQSVPAVLDPDTVSHLRDLIDTALARNGGAGLRNLLGRLPALGNLAHGPVVRALVEPILGNRARLVRALLFNKNRQRNWQVAWHQDLSIAVEQRLEMPGFSGWSLKAGVHHVQPPVAILERMLSVRLHLDPADADNGALWVSPGTHRLGRIPSAGAADLARRHGEQLCAMAAGDGLLFRPLLLHASWKASSDRPRRVIHLEFAAAGLPPPLTWHEPT